DREEGGTSEDALEEEDDLDIPTEEATQIRAEKKESLMDKIFQTHIDKDANTSAATVPTTPIVIRDTISITLTSALSAPQEVLTLALLCIMH
ncbi:hypothetical protein HAX54_021168, partial [Datura stramonium]|nr:hypothetical protein [Datura stramonium]